MPGGISYVLERVMKKQGRAMPELHGGVQYSATKGSYTAHMEYDNRGDRVRFELVHYGTRILSIHFPSHSVSGGYGTVSSSGAINKALRELKIPCWWSRSSDQEGFWCGKREWEGRKFVVRGRTKWKGDPDGPAEYKRHLKEHEARIAMNRKARQLARPGGLFQKPGVKYSPLARKKMAELQEDYLGGGTEHRTVHLCPECYEDYEAGLIQFTTPGLRVVRVASIDKCDNHSSG